LVVDGVMPFGLQLAAEREHYFDDDRLAVTRKLTRWHMIITAAND